MRKRVIFYDAYYIFLGIRLGVNLDQLQDVGTFTRGENKSGDNRRNHNFNYRNTTMTQVDATVKMKGPITKC